MKNKITNEQIGQFIGDLAQQIRDELDYDLRVAKGQMSLAENDLVDTLTPAQKQLYDTFCQKRNAFYKIANDLYIRVYWFSIADKKHGALFFPYRKSSALLIFNLQL